MIRYIRNTAVSYWRFITTTIRGFMARLLLCSPLFAEFNFSGISQVRFLAQTRKSSKKPCFSDFLTRSIFSCEEILTNGLRQRPSGVLLCSARQKYCRCCSTFGVGSELEKWYLSDAEKWSRIFFFENPKPICTDRSSWIYFSRLLVRRSTIPTCKGSAFARCNKELESGEILTTACCHSLYNMSSYVR